MNSKNCFEKIEATVVYVTHDQVEAMTLADRVVVLDHGRVQQIGAPEELYRRPANRFVASFIGSPSHESVRGPAHRRRVSTRRRPRVRTRLDWSGDAVVGVRPEHIVTRRFRDSGARSNGWRIWERSISSESRLETLRFP